MVFLSEFTFSFSQFHYVADHVGDTELDDEVTDCALVEHQFKKGFIRLREYLERRRGCGRQGNFVIRKRVDDGLTSGKVCQNGWVAMFWYP